MSKPFLFCSISLIAVLICACGCDVKEMLQVCADYADFGIQGRQFESFGRTCTTYKSASGSGQNKGAAGGRHSAQIALVISARAARIAPEEQKEPESIPTLSMRGFFILSGLLGLFGIRD